MAVLPKVRSALCAASQLQNIPGEGAIDVEDAPAPARLANQNLMMMMMMMMIMEHSYGLEIF